MEFDPGSTNETQHEIMWHDIISLPVYRCVCCFKPMAFWTKQWQEKGTYRVCLMSHIPAQDPNYDYVCTYHALLSIGPNLNIFITTIQLQLVPSENAYFSVTPLWKTPFGNSNHHRRHNIYTHVINAYKSWYNERIEWEPCDLFRSPTYLIINRYFAAHN